MDKKKIFHAAKSNKEGLLMLKNALVKLGDFETASELRKIELKCFPETQEQKDAKERAKELNVMFRMVGLNIPEAECWIIEKSLDKFKKTKSFSIKDASFLTLQKEKLFS